MKQPRGLGRAITAYASRSTCLGGLFSEYMFAICFAPQPELKEA